MSLFVVKGIVNIFGLMDKFCHITVVSYLGLFVASPTVVGISH